MLQYTNVLVIKAPTDYWRDVPDKQKTESDLIIKITEYGFVRIIKDKHNKYSNNLYPPTIDGIINNYNIPLESVLQLEKIKSRTKE